MKGLGGVGEGGKGYKTSLFQSADHCARCFLGGLAFSFPAGSGSGLSV